jgi:hypothetical protein
MNGQRAIKRIPRLSDRIHWIPFGIRFSVRCLWVGFRPSPCASELTAYHRLTIVAIIVIPARLCKSPRLMGKFANLYLGAAPLLQAAAAGSWAWMWAIGKEEKGSAVVSDDCASWAGHRSGWRGEGGKDGAARILVKTLVDLLMSRYFAHSVISPLVYLESVKMSGVKRHERETAGTNRGRRPQDRCSGL